MSIRSYAIKWLNLNYKNVVGPIYTSKYYTPEESWPKTRVWWLQIPITSIDLKPNEYVNLICEAQPNKNDFHYLKMPIKFLNEHLEKFHRMGEIISLYLSANPDTLFIEERGEGRLDFSKFLVEKN